MASIVISGDTSGTVTLAAPTVAGTQSYTLPTAVPAANGYALTSTTGGVMSWAAASASPGGSTTQVQYNNAGAFAGSSNMTFNGTSLTLANDASINSLTVGRGAGAVATNVAVGVGSLATTTSCAYNTAVGTNVMPVFNRTADTSGFNAGFGWNTLAALTTGNNNTCIGSQAGVNLTSGSNNTSLGYAAGVGAGGISLSTGSSNTYIGYGAQPSSNTVSYEMSVVAFSALNTAAGKGTNTGFIAVHNGTSFGSVYQGNNGASWATTSDQRIKKNVVNLGNSLDKINALRVVEFDYKENDKHEIGFIAQEFEQHFPEQIVRHAPNEAEKEWVGEDQVMGIQQNLVPFLVKAMQELSAALDAANARIAALEAK